MIRISVIPSRLGGDAKRTVRPACRTVLFHVWQWARLQESTDTLSETDSGARKPGPSIRAPTNRCHVTTGCGI